MSVAPSALILLVHVGLVLGDDVPVPASVGGDMSVSEGPRKDDTRSMRVEGRLLSSSIVGVHVM